MIAIQVVQALSIWKLLLWDSPLRPQIGDARGRTVRSNFCLSVFNAGLIAAVAILPLAGSPASAKQMQLSIQPDATQIAGMDHGSEIVISRTATTEVWMQIPAPDDRNRIPISFMFVNKSNNPINVGPEIFSAEGVTIIPYEKLIAEQGSRETVRNIGHVFANLGRFAAANDAGTSTTSYSFSGGTNYGGSFSGSGSITSVNPFIRQRALEQAADESTGRRDQMDQKFANARNMIAANMRSTTVMPNQRMTGVLTFELPRALRGASGSQRFTMSIAMGSDRHVLTGYAGPFGTVPTVTPSPELAALLAPRPAPSTPVALAQINPGPTFVQPVSASARSTPSPSQKLALSTQSYPAQRSATRVTDVDQTRAQSQPTPARRGDWGLVEVQSQVGY